MLRHVTKLGLIALILGVFVPEASAFRHCGWRGCCGYGGCGYYGYGYGGYAGYYGGGYYGWGAVGYPVPGAYPAPTTSPAPAANPAPAATYGGQPQTSIVAPAANSVALLVTVPADAKVYVNGHLTKSTGEHRQYSSSGLKPDSSYEYQVRAEFVRDGKPVREEKTVLLTVGKTSSLVFDATPSGQLADVATTGSR